MTTIGENHYELTEDAPGPITAYGRSKLAAEKAIRTTGVSFTIPRPHRSRPTADGRFPVWLLEYAVTCSLQRPKKSEPDAETALLMREEDIGWVTPPEDPQAIAQAISLAASAASSTAERGHRAAIVASRFTRQIALNAYCDLMDRLLNRQLSRNRIDFKSVA
jgi:hypothetical protein